MLIQENVFEIQVLHEIRAQSIYGARTPSGVVVIIVPENAIFEKIASELNQ